MDSNKNEVIILGSYSPTSKIGGRVISARGLAPTIMAGTHGYGFGCILVENYDSKENQDTDKHR